MGQVAENVKSVLTLSLEASANNSSNQWKGMKMTANGEVTICGATTDKPIGILTNDPSADGQEAAILVIGVCPIIAGETITYDDMIRIHSDGKAYIFVRGTDTTTYSIGRCIRGADSGEKIVAVIDCANPTLGNSD